MYGKVFRKKKEKNTIAYCAVSPFLVLKRTAKLFSRVVVPLYVPTGSQSHPVSTSSSVSGVIAHFSL